jgi:hypothetical protein
VKAKRLCHGAGAHRVPSDADAGNRSGCSWFSGAEEETARRWVMRRILFVVTAVLLVLVLSFALAGCRKSSGNKGGGGYLPAPRSTVPTVIA